MSESRPVTAPGSATGSDPATRRGMPPWLERVETLSPVVVHLVAAILVAGVGFLDWATGPDLSLSIFYLAPVSMVAWRSELGPAVAWSMVAVIAWVIADRAAGSDLVPAIQYWNAAVRLAFFLTVAAALSGIRRLWETERALASTDFLTGALNSRTFHERLELERSRTERTGRPFTLVYLDVDRFKQINDTRGHSAGDAALVLIARTIAEGTRAADSLARLGGDEFALLLPETDGPAAETALDKIQRRLQEVADVQGLDIGFSMGGVVSVDGADGADGLIRQADALMYEVKRTPESRRKIIVLASAPGAGAVGAGASKGSRGPAREPGD